MFRYELSVTTKYVSTPATVPGLGLSVVAKAEDHTHRVRVKHNNILGNKHTLFISFPLQECDRAILNGPHVAVIQGKPAFRTVKSAFYKDEPPKEIHPKGNS